MQPVPLGPPAPAPEQWPTTPFVPMFGPVPPRGFLRFGGLLIGIVALVGMASFHAALMIPPPNLFGTPNPELAAYQATLRVLIGVGLIAMDVAVVLGVMFAWYVAVGKPDATDGSRRAVLTFATVFLAVWLIVSFFALSAFSLFFILR